MATPLTELRLLNNVDLDTTYNHTFSKELFGSLAGQVSFFKGKTASGMTFTNLSFQRKERTIKVKKAYESIEPLTYGMFQNNTNSKWYFFFISDIMYVSDHVTEIKIEIDVEQTYLFDATLSDCFVEREHVGSDNIGEHLVDENVDTGELINRSIIDTTALNELAIILASTQFGALPDDGRLQGGVYNKLLYIAYESSTAGLTELNSYLNVAGNAAEVVSLFMYPKELIKGWSSGSSYIIPEDTNLELIATITKNYDDIDGYVPKNNKVYNYPYNFLEATNNQGTTHQYKYEYGQDTTMEFLISGNVQINPVVKLTPRDYKIGNNERVYSESIDLLNFPVCGWLGDVYKTWLAQSYYGNTLNTGSALLSLGVGIATKNVVGTASSLLSVAQSIGSVQDKKLQPPTLNGQFSGFLPVAINLQTFTFYKRTITSEFAIIIDNYFDKFGYKVNVIKTPDTGTRSRYNYLKLQDCVLKGSVPREALSTMISNRVKGITFWHVDDIGNYSPTNSILQ